MSKKQKVYSGKPKVFIINYEAEFKGRQKWNGSVSVSATDETPDEVIEKRARHQISTILKNRFNLKLSKIDDGAYIRTSDRITKQLEDGTYDPAETEHD